MEKESLGIVIEKHKKMIQTIITRLNKIITQYSEKDQIIIKEFLNIVNYFEEAETNRKQLLEKMNTYKQKLYGTDLYLETPFLWFTETYIDMATVTLGTTDFHARSFYEYLVTYLRKNAVSPGVYALIRDKTPLNDPIWSKLQALSYKLIEPLTKDQIQIILRINQLIREKGIYSFDLKEIQSSLYEIFPRYSAYKQQLESFFTLLRCQWILLFYSPAFGLDRVFTRFSLPNSNNLNEIINFKSKENSVLGMSDIYRILNAVSEFIGIFYVPINETKSFSNYLQYMESEEKIKLIDISGLQSIQRSTSLHSYHSNTGWRDFTIKEMKGLLTGEVTGIQEISSDELFYLTPVFAKDWYYHQHSLPLEVIKLYSRIPSIYNFSNLPLTKTRPKSTKNLSHGEKGLIKNLYDKRVIQMIFVPWRLVYEYSFDLYWVLIPKTSEKQLFSFLKTIPYAEIYSTENFIGVRGFLSPKLVKLINQITTWSIYPITFAHFPQSVNIDWYEEKKLQWKIPKIFPDLN
jgi:hypothetical protein